MSDPYRDLPPDLLAVLRDPRVVLPGEAEIYDGVSRWVDASTIPAEPRYRNAEGNWVTARSDT